LCLLRRTVLCRIPKDDGASSREESAMKCSNLNCSHRIGLVSYQRGWFDKRRFCSKKCRDDFTVERPRPRPSQQEHLAGSYFNWLFANATSQAASRRRNWRKGPLQRIGGRPRSLARIRVESPMSALGQKPTFCDVQAMSSLPTKKRKFGGAMECPPEADMSVQRHNRSGLRTSSSHSVSFVSVIWDRRFIAKRRSRLQQRSDK